MKNIKDINTNNLGRDIFELVKRKTSVLEFVEVDKITKENLSNVATLILDNHQDKLVEYFLYKSKYKNDLRTEVIQVFSNIIEGQILDVYYFDKSYNKYISRIINMSKSISVEDKMKEIFSSVIEEERYIYVDRDCLSVENSELMLEINDELLKLAVLNIEPYKIAEGSISENLNNLIIKYLESKGYAYKELEDICYIPIPEEEKMSKVRNILDKLYIKYEEREKEKDFIVSDRTTNGVKEVELYIDSCSQYTINKKSSAYHYSNEDKFIEHLTLILNLVKLDKAELEMKKLMNDLDENNILYEILNSKSVLIISKVGKKEISINENSCLVIEDETSIHTTNDKNNYLDLIKFVIS